ncbi:hypothetical protein EDB84DRAFT_441047 [Lactarius hengduanensis]|nr:hypothetical protein EDB84DRAFT_441047 [Lactarius hengduanensis]
MGPAGPSSVNYGSSSAQPAFIPRRDPARNQRPHLPLLAAHIDGPQVQSHLHRGSQHVAYSLSRPPSFAPGGNPRGHQTPGMITATPPRPWNHHQNRSRGLYSPYPLPRRQENVGYQRDDLHSQTFQQFEVPGWPVFMTNNLGSISPHSLNWDGQAIAPPHGSHVNEVAPTPTRSATVPAPETTLPGFSTGTQPAGAPALGTEAPPEESQSTTGTCPSCAYVSCGRLQELERHVLKHLPHYIYCPRPDCNWRGSRRYSLIDHYKKQHGEVLDRDSADAFTIYDGKRMAKRLVNREVTLEHGDRRSECLDADEGSGAGQVGRVEYALRVRTAEAGTTYPSTCFFFPLSPGFTVFTVRKRIPLYHCFRLPPCKQASHKRNCTRASTASGPVGGNGAISSGTEMGMFGK